MFGAFTTSIHISSHSNRRGFLPRIRFAFEARLSFAGKDTIPASLDGGLVGRFVVRRHDGHDDLPERFHFVVHISSRHTSCALAARDIAMLAIRMPWLNDAGSDNSGRVSAMSLFRRTHLETSPTIGRCARGA